MFVPFTTKVKDTSMKHIFNVLNCSLGLSVGLRMISGAELSCVPIDF